MMNSQIFILFGILSAWSCDEERIQVGVPEFSCKNGQILNKQSNTTTIKLLDNEIDDVKYKFNVKFRTTDNKCYNNQRCTLMMWRDVREFNAFLNQFSTNGVLKINNTLIKPGIEYIIEVIMTKNEQIIEKKQLFIDYVTNEYVTTIVKPEASVNLLGSKFGYTFSPFYIYADVHLCKNISYYLKWSLSEKGKNITILPYRGRELFIPSNSFNSSKNYDLKTEIINSNDSSTVALTQQEIKILAKDIRLYMPIRIWTTRVNQPIHVKSFLKNFDDTENIKMKWLCVEIATNETCIYQGETKETEADTFFTKPGKYNITLEVFQGNKTLTDSCTINVAEEAPIVDIDEIDNPINPLNGLEIRTTIYEIQTFCTLQWISVETNGYEWLNLSRVPGNPSELVNVTIKEDMFLNELEEFSNDSVDLSHNLVIPPPNEMWEGLKGDCKYLFRLVITCPGPDSEEATEMYNDVLIETNSPPLIQPLQVTPLEGIALTTLFQFKTETAQDKETDRPILYKFGYYLKEETIVLRNLLEVSETELSLPYSEIGVQTFVECCDNFSNCRRLNGPLVKLNLPQSTDKEIILKEFSEKMLLEDYSNAFKSAIGILNTYEKDVPVHVFVVETIDKEIEKFLNIDNGGFNHEWINNVNNLMESISMYNTHLQLPETSLNKLIDLRDKISTLHQRFTKRNIETRRKRAIINLNDTRNYIALSELMIMRSTDPHKINIEKENLRLQIKNYMEQLCTNLKKNEIKQALSTLLLSVEKMSKNSLNRFISVPYENNPWNNTARIKFGNIVLLKDAKQKCIGKAVFKEYLEKPGLLYYTDIINSRNNLDLGEVIVYLPRNLSMEGKPKCLVYRDGWQSSCKFVHNLPSFVQCSCKHLGYYYLEYSKIGNTSTEKPIEKVIAETTATNVEAESANNDSFAQIYGEGITTTNYDTVSYVVIVVSVIGIVVVTVILRKIFHDDDDDDKEDSEPFDFPKYAQLHNEEYLNDAHI